jgi:hypothetical protein
LLAKSAWHWSSALVILSPPSLFSCHWGHSVWSPLYLAHRHFLLAKTVRSRSSAVALEMAFGCFWWGESSGSWVTHHPRVWPLFGGWSNMKRASLAGWCSAFELLQGTGSRKYSGWWKNGLLWARRREVGSMGRCAGGARPGRGVGQGPGLPKESVHIELFSGIVLLGQGPSF